MTGRFLEPSTEMGQAPAVNREGLGNVATVGISVGCATFMWPIKVNVVNCWSAGGSNSTGQDSKPLPVTRRAPTTAPWSLERPRRTPQFTPWAFGFRPPPRDRRREALAPPHATLHRVVVSQIDGEDDSYDEWLLQNENDPTMEGWTP